MKFTLAIKVFAAAVAASSVDVLADNRNVVKEASHHLPQKTNVATCSPDETNCGGASIACDNCCNGYYWQGALRYCGTDDECKAQGTPCGGATYPACTSCCNGENYNEGVYRYCGSKPDGCKADGEVCGGLNQACSTSCCSGQKHWDWATQKCGPEPTTTSSTSSNLRASGNDGGDVTKINIQTNDGSMLEIDIKENGNGNGN